MCILDSMWNSENVEWFFPFFYQREALLYKILGAFHWSEDLVVPSLEWRHWVRESLCLQHKQAFVVIQSIVQEPIFSESEQEPVFVAHEIPRFIEGDHHSDLSCFFVDFSYSDQRTNRFTSRACWNSRVRAHLEVSPSSLSSIRELLFCHRSSIIRFWITYTK